MVNVSGATINKLSFEILTTGGQRLSIQEGADKISLEACRYLENGGIIYLPVSPFSRSASDTTFLLQQKQENASYRKNISYRPVDNSIHGIKNTNQETLSRLQSIMNDFSLQAQNLVKNFLAPYCRDWKIDYASFRPQEEKGRKMRLRARNDLLHVDSFSTRITRGRCMLRVFENISKDKSRIWKTSLPFEKLAANYMPLRSAPSVSPLAILEKLPLYKNLINALGLRSNANSAYDRWMLAFHNFLKESSSFQENTPKDYWEFPPGSAWIVFTDIVSHAVVSGQYALEQTFFIAPNDLVLPEKAPVNILKQFYGNF